MPIQEFTLDDLMRTMREAAGEAEGLGGDILDVEFDELGYDSLAVMETAARIEQQSGIQLDDFMLLDVQTPRTLLAMINAHPAVAGPPQGPAMADLKESA
jgi:minimal PKS acyl carrier protein